jgi:hypothetical protein
LAVFDYAQANSLADTVAWLRKDGIETSKSAVSYFLDWYQLRQQFAADEATTDGLLEQLKSEVPNLTEAQLDELGQRTFSLLAIRRKDLDGFVTVRSARAKGELEKAKLQLRERAENRLRESLELQREKFQRETLELFLRWRQDQETNRIAEMSVPNEERIRLLRKHWFQDVDELEKAGTVKIPK